ncbi:hypothetical protein CSC3H3_13985 [Thalassospira marina]|uniref:Uncharacterized protein n=1 Tax=Thalassospira marina TaxID=2048283 RepID=A0ABM6QAY6_9PROT|nr:hypothetical protein CSC3H3_13985 [Thalassospira marina]
MPGDKTPIALFGNGSLVAKSAPKQTNAARSGIMRHCVSSRRENIAICRVSRTQNRLYIKGGDKPEYQLRII